MPKKTVEEEINAFLDVWGADEMISFFNDLLPLFILYNVDIDAKEADWVIDTVGLENAHAVRVAQTAYLLVKFAEKHAGKLCSLKIQFKDLPKRMEKLDASKDIQTS